MLMDDYDFDEVAYDTTDADIVATYGLLADPAVAAALLDIEDCYVQAITDLRLPPLTSVEVVRTRTVHITRFVTFTVTERRIISRFVPGVHHNTTITTTTGVQS